MTYVLGITGRARSGKDTAAVLLSTINPEKGYRRAAFADPLKDMAAILCDEPVHLFHTDLGKASLTSLHGRTRRSLLQLLGTECLKPHFGEDVWCRLMEKKIKDGSLGPRVVITDLRFDAEAEMVHHLGGKVLLIERLESGLAGAEADHASERGIDPDKVDYTIQNNGSLRELEYELRKVVLNLEGGAA